MTEIKPDEDAPAEEQEEQDWLPEQSKVKAKRRGADYQRVDHTCNACE